MKAISTYGTIVGAALLLSACSSGSNGALTSPTASVPQTGTGFRAPQIMRNAGLDSVIGERATTLSRRFGDARIDLVEGDARKLQYASDRCILDIYLYPLQANADPVATHVEARNRNGGAETDRAGCIAEVERAATTR
ncbi:MAG: hypothetical protein ABJN35_12255 [Erythrobacter sp.]